MNEDYSETEKKILEGFHNIKVPEDAINRVNMGINQGMKEKENTKGKIYELKPRKNKIIKTITALAAAFVIMIGVANSTADISYAMSNIPVIGSVFELMTFRNFDYKNKGYEIKGNEPSVVADKDNEQASKTAAEVNEDINNTINTAIAELKKEEEQNEGKGHHGINIESSTVSDTKNFKSIKLSILETQASGYERNKYYTFNKKTGKLITLPELFGKDKDYKKIINKELKTQMITQMKNDENIYYFLDNDPAESKFKGISSDQQFYIDNNGKLHICFDQYEIAPGYMGALDFTLKTHISL